MDQDCAYWPAASYDSCCAGAGYWELAAACYDGSGPLVCQCPRGIHAAAYIRGLLLSTRLLPTSHAADKYNRGVPDATCSAPPPPPEYGKECSSTGPANFYTCCAEKAAQTPPEYDPRRVAADARARCKLMSYRRS